MAEEQREHPRSGVDGWMRRFLPELVYGANDGVVTTLAVIAGVTGARLSPAIILVLGFANLLADGFSMGASDVLSERSTQHAAARPSLRRASRHGLATFTGFVIAGVAPLLAYLLPVFAPSRFTWACVLAGCVLFLVGAGRARFSDRRALSAGLEMLTIGALAAAVAYAVGRLGAMLGAAGGSG